MVSALFICAIAFLIIFAGALLGLVLHRALPDPHFSAESKDVEGEGRIDRGA